MKSILLYVVLVGLPLLGIVGLLQVGQSLSAPISLAGKWNVQLVPAQPQGPARQDGVLRASPGTLSITQSGPNLRLSFDHTPSPTFEGSIRDVTINATVLDRRTAAMPNPANYTAAPIAFRATVDRQARPERLFGILIFGDGPSRAEVRLTATRQREDREATGDR